MTDARSIDHSARRLEAEDRRHAVNRQVLLGELPHFDALRFGQIGLI